MRTKFARTELYKMKHPTVLLIRVVFFFFKYNESSFDQGPWFGGCFLQYVVSHNLTSDIFSHVLLIFSKTEERIWILLNFYISYHNGILNTEEHKNPG